MGHWEGLGAHSCSSFPVAGLRQKQWPLETKEERSVGRRLPRFMRSGGEEDGKWILCALNKGPTGLPNEREAGCAKIDLGSSRGCEPEQLK